jgi:hypothetical protein
MTDFPVACISIPVRFLLLFAAADDLLPCICSGRSVEVNSGTTALRTALALE